MSSHQLDLHASGQAEAVVRMIEMSMQVRRRYQFFGWSQDYCAALLPHQISVCGTYQRGRKELVFEPFHTVLVPTPALAALCDGGSVLMQQIVGAWIDARGTAVAIDLAQLAGDADAADRTALLEVGLGHLLVHGVARPGRPSELESLFILAAQHQRWTEQQREFMELMLPYLHTTYLRVQATEREMRGLPVVAPASARPGERRAMITERERQILAGVREGKSNLEIGVALEISALTVKNHVQKILRKLGAANRAQAVAKAMSLNLLGRSTPDSRNGHAEAASLAP